MRKLATVLPTRMVHKKFSGCSRYLWRTLAERRPARICCRMRNRLKANTPASIPDKTKDTARQAMNVSQIRTWLFILSFNGLHKQLPHPPLIAHLRAEFQAPKKHRS